MPSHPPGWGFKINDMSKIDYNPASDHLKDVRQNTINRTLRSAEQARRKAEGSPDKEKLLNFAADLLAYPFPDLETQEARNIKDAAMEKITRLASQIRGQAEAL